MNLQILAKSHPKMPSSYTTINVNLEEIIFPNRIQTNFMTNSDFDREQNAMKANKVA
jgi:hypothetical protein